MEAPENIFLHPDIGGREFIRPWLKRRANQESVEYTRTEAFFEKVENFLEMLGRGFTITDNVTHTNYGKEQLIEDFKNYMKGESL